MLYRIPCSPVKILVPTPISSVKTFTAPIKRLFEILSICPLNRSHGPAGEIWSVVHCPLAFINTGKSSKFFPFQAGNGFKSCIRSLSGETFTTIFDLSSGGDTNPSLPVSNPFAGNSSPTGASNLTNFPSSFGKKSLTGLYDKRPPNAIAVTISGDPIKARVAAFPSFLLAKFRLKEVTIVFFFPSVLSNRFH